jgi:hypothetical protein
MTTLADLVGLKVLTGVDLSSVEFPQEGAEDSETCNVCRFVLDDVTYLAIEDPTDGYRSHMRELQSEDGNIVSNVFPPVPVFCLHVENEGDDQCDLLHIYDSKTAKLVLRVGTIRTDDYYPRFVSEFSPQNMILNT